eukprot:1582727-Rhodomonas_salina.5
MSAPGIAESASDCRTDRRWRCGQPPPPKAEKLAEQDPMASLPAGQRMWPANTRDNQETFLSPCSD